MNELDLNVDKWFNFPDWTTTAIELWNDKEFIEKRINEQETYIQIQELKFFAGTISSERFRETVVIAFKVGNRFADRLKELNSNIA